jgi:general secretion pathway protein I
MTRVTRSAGFTLIEVLVALVIAAMGLGAVLGVITSASRNAGYLRQKTFASWVGQNLLTELRIGGTIPSTTSVNGEVENFAGSKWAFTRKVTDAGVPGLVRVDITVRLADAPATDTLATVTGFVGATATTAPPSTTAWDVVTTGATGGAAGGAAGASTTASPMPMPMGAPTDGTDSAVTPATDGPSATGNPDGTTPTSGLSSLPLPINPRGNSPQ